MKKEIYTLKVYNTLTKQYEEVVVTKKVYDTYRQTEWNIKDNDESFYDHEIQISGLIGGEDDAYENFREFIDDVNIPEYIFMTREGMMEVRKAVCVLPMQERNLIIALYYERLTENEYADKIGVSQQYVSKSKKKILKKLKLFLEKRL
ncbi:MAG: sigma-70 family RNA polymerase sigma factor [Clostridia bacterium]|nr:sigma-70 family RNA polymerase sigma factor [Clostridia bacterium]